MVPHPKTMQMVTDQRWREQQVLVARERLGMSTQRAVGERGRNVAAYAAAWSTARASVPFVLRAIPRMTRYGCFHRVTPVMGRD
jgi:hypothetical protein